MTAYDKVDDAIRDYKEKVDRLYTASALDSETLAKEISILRDRLQEALKILG